MRLAAGSEQRWSPRCWVGADARAQDSVWSRRIGQDITVSDIAAAARLYEETKRLELLVIEVDTTITEDDLADRVTEALGL